MLLKAEKQFKSRKVEEIQKKRKKNKKETKEPSGTYFSHGVTGEGKDPSGTSLIQQFLSLW